MSRTTWPFDAGKAFFMDFSLAALPHEACFLLSMGVSVYENGTKEERAKFDGDEYFLLVPL